MQNTGSSLAARKRKKSKRTRFIIRNLFFLALAIYGITVLIHQQTAMIRANDVIAEYNEKILVEADKRVQLQNELKEVNTDEYLIQKTREKLGLVRANERVFIDMSKTGNN